MKYNTPLPLLKCILLIPFSKYQAIHLGFLVEICVTIFTPPYEGFDVPSYFDVSLGWEFDCILLIKDYFVTVSSILDKKEWRLLPLSPMYVFNTIKFIPIVKIRIKHSQICEITLNGKQCIKSFFLHSLFGKLSNKSSTWFKVCKLKCSLMIIAFSFYTFNIRNLFLLKHE